MSRKPVIVTIGKALAEHNRAIADMSGSLSENSTHQAPHCRVRNMTQAGM